MPETPTPDEGRPYFVQRPEDQERLRLQPPPQATSTPGQVAYYAYWHGWPALPPMPWTRLCRAERRAWNAAAQAVLRAWQAQCGPVNGTTPTRQREERR